MCRILLGRMLDFAVITDCDICPLLRARLIWPLHSQVLDIQSDKLARSKKETNFLHLVSHR